MKNILLFLLILLISCSSQENIDSTDNNEHSNIELFNTFFYNLSISSVEDSLSISNIAALEGSYAGLEIIFSDTLINTTFKITLPTIKTFGVWVGLCTSEGCIIEFKTPDPNFILTQNDFLGLKDINDNPINPMLYLITKKNNSIIEDTLFFKEFSIDVKEFKVEDNKLFFKAVIEGQTKSGVTINGNFNIKEFEMGQIFI